MKLIATLVIGLFLFVACSLNSKSVEAKSYIRSYYRSSGTSVRGYIRYKADGYKFNNYVFRPDRGYRRQ